MNDGYQLRDGCKERIDRSDGGITGPLGDGKDTGCICIGVDATVEQEYKVPAGIAESEISQSSFTESFSPGNGAATHLNKSARTTP